MKWNYSLAALAVLAVLFVAGCRSLPYFFRLGNVAQDQAAPPVETLAADHAQVSYLKHGRHVFVTKCTKCHAAMPIGDFAADDWTGDILPRMSKKAKLSGEEANALAQYVAAVVNR